MQYSEDKKSVNPTLVWVLLCGAFIGMFTGTFTGAAQAQMKVGANPQSLAADTNLQVEATTNASDGGQFVVKKSTGNVGIGTLAPTNTLHIGRAAVANTLGIRTPVANAALLGTNANGDVIVQPAAASCTCGEIKQAMVTLPAPWRKLDGTATGANNCNLPATLPNADGLVLVQGGTAGNTSAAATLAQNQLPNVAPTITVNSTTATNIAVGDHQHYNPRVDRWSSNEGNHNHSYGRTDPAAEVVQGGSGAVVVGREWETITNTSAFAGAHAHWTNIGDYWSNGSGGHNHTQNAHGHTATASSINGGVTPSALTAANLPRLNVNTFVCVN